MTRAPAIILQGGVTQFRAISATNRSHEFTIRTGICKPQNDCHTVRFEVHPSFLVTPTTSQPTQCNVINPTSIYLSALASKAEGHCRRLTRIRQISTNSGISTNFGCLSFSVSGSDARATLLYFPDGQLLKRVLLYFQNVAFFTTTAKS